MVSAIGSGAELYCPFSECSPTAKGSEGCMSMKNMNNKKVFGRLDIDVYPVDNKDKPNYTGLFYIL